MAYTQQPGRDAYVETQILTRAAPTTSTADGVPLTGLVTLTVVVQADSGTTITGGTMRGYMYDEYVASWFRCAELDFTPGTGVRRSSANFVVEGNRSTSRVLWATDTVTVGAGTTVEVYILGGRKGV